MWRPIKMVISLRLLSFLRPLLVSIFASCLNQWSSNYNQNVLKSYFSAVEQAQFLLIGYIGEFKILSQQFQMVTTTKWPWWCWGRGRRHYPGPAQAPPTQTALGLFDGWCLIPDSILNGRELHHPRNSTPHSANYKEIHKWYKSQIQNTQIHILNGRELHHPRNSIPLLLHTLPTIKLSI